MASIQLAIAKSDISAFCERHGIRTLALFGSVLTERFTDASDVDVLVEFKPGVRVGYLRMSAMERELSDLYRRKVDLRTPNELSRYFRDEVVRSAALQYAAE